MVLLPETEKDISVYNHLPHHKKGSTLLKERERSSNGYYVLRGCIRTFYLIDGGLGLHVGYNF